MTNLVRLDDERRRRMRHSYPARDLRRDLSDGLVVLELVEDFASPPELVAMISDTEAAETVARLRAAIIYLTAVERGILGRLHRGGHDAKT